MIILTFIFIKYYIIKAYSFVFTVLFLFLIISFFKSCETDNTNEENSLYETIITPQSRQAIDRDETSIREESDPEEREHTNEEYLTKYNNLYYCYFYNNSIRIFLLKNYGDS